VKQFILNREPDRDNTVRLEGNDYRYLVRVRRLAVGESFQAILPGGEETLVQIISIDKGALTGKCVPPEPDFSGSDTDADKTQLPKIILFQALPKGDKMDLIVRQAAEGGITEIVPFISEFSIGRAKAEGQKFLRWERIIKEARQQSGSKTATFLHEECLTISGLFEYWGKLQKDGAGALGLLFHHIRLTAGRGLEKKSLHGYLNSVPKTAALAIGPEGGFSEREVSLFLENNFKPFTIGDSVLRTETAALYCAAAVKIILLERDSWEPNKMKQYSASTC
jgi:16S rRNA (uracil1498-N3)-methyltransferase